MTILCKNCGEAIDLPRTYAEFTGDIKCKHCGAVNWVCFSKGWLLDQALK